MRKGFTLIEGLVVIAILAVIAVLIGLVLHGRGRPYGRGGGGRPRCQGRLHNLGLSYAMYRIDYGTYPESLNGDYRQKSDESIALLYPLYLEAIDTLDCPGGNGVRAEYIDDPSDPLNLSGEPIVTGGDYTQDDRISERAGPMRVVVADRMDDGKNHGRGAWCLFKDGHVAFSKGLERLGGIENPNPEFPDSDPRIYHYDGGVDMDGDGFNTRAAGIDDAHLEGEIDANDTDPNVH